jgi:hypothetical protein
LIFWDRELKLTLRNYIKNKKERAANISTIFRNTTIEVLNCVIKGRQQAKTSF